MKEEEGWWTCLLDPVSGLLVFFAWLLEVYLVPENPSATANYLLPGISFGRLAQLMGGAAPAGHISGCSWRILVVNAHPAHGRVLPTVYWRAWHLQWGEKVPL